MQFDISYFVIPPIDDSIGRFKVKQYQNGNTPRVEKNFTNIATKDCSDERKYRERIYWSERMGDNRMDEAIDLYQCMDDDSLYLRSTKILPDYAQVIIEFENCIEYAENPL